MANVGRKSVGLIMLGMVVFFIGLRLALPEIIKRSVYSSLEKSLEYQGHVGEIDVSLLRGAYVIHDTVITRVGGAAPVPFLEIDTVEFSVEWMALFNGALVAQVELHRPRLTFIEHAAEGSNQAGAEVDWGALVRALVPLDINRFAVYEGDVRYNEYDAEASEPSVELRVADLRIEAYNLTNSKGLERSVPGSVTATGRALDLGEFTLSGEVAPYADMPTFDVDGQLKNLPVTRLNGLIRLQHTRFEVEAGTMNLRVKVVAANGQFDGYVKPTFAGLKVIDHQADLQPEAEGQADTRRLPLQVPLAGKLDESQAGRWSVVLGAVHHGVVDALFRGLDHEVRRAKAARLAVSSAPEPNKVKRSAPKAARTPQAQRQAAREEKADARQTRREEKKKARKRGLFAPKEDKSPPKAKKKLFRKR